MSLFLILFLFLIRPTNSFAQNTTVTPTIDPKAEEIKKMNEKIVQDMQTETNTVSTTTPKSVVGTISQIKEDQIIVDDNNKNKTINITSDTVYVDAKKNKTKLSNLKSGQVILSMGYYNESGNFTAKRIVVTSLEAIQNKNEIIFGTIADISQTTNVLVLIPLKNKNTQYQIKTDSKTEVVDKSGNNLTVNKLKSGQKVVVVIQPDAKISNTFDVSKIITIDSSPISPTPTPKNK